jgi:biopolymer transport protein ExbD
MPKKLPEYNASSLADIAFMLLIFFLVTTTMDTDSGIERILPQWIDPKDIEDTPPIKERNIFVVLVDRNDRLMVEGELTRVDDLKEQTKLFLTNPYDDENLPEKTVQDVPFFGPYETLTKGAVISLRNDVGTTYGTYIAVQNELIAAINELREEISNQKFGKSYDDLSKEQREAVKVIYPQNISEAEPKKIGGN